MKAILDESEWYEYEALRKQHREYFKQQINMRLEHIITIIRANRMDVIDDDDTKPRLTSRNYSHEMTEKLCNEVEQLKIP